MGLSHHVAVGCVANIVYICAASMFRIKVSRVYNCLGYLCIDREDGGSMFLSNFGTQPTATSCETTNIGFILAVNYHKGLKSVIQMFVTVVENYSGNVQFIKQLHKKN